MTNHNNLVFTSHPCNDSNNFCDNELTNYIELYVVTGTNFKLTIISSHTATFTKTHRSNVSAVSDAIQPTSANKKNLSSCWIWQKKTLLKKKYYSNSRVRLSFIVQNNNSKENPQLLQKQKIHQYRIWNMEIRSNNQYTNLSWMYSLFMSMATGQLWEFQVTVKTLIFFSVKCKFLCSINN